VSPPSPLAVIPVSVKVGETAGLLLEVERGNDKMKAAKAEYEQMLIKYKKVRHEVTLPFEEGHEYALECSHPGVTVPPSLAFKPKNPRESVPVGVTMAAYFRETAVDILMANPYRSDVRRYRLAIKAHMPRVETSIEMRCRARQTTNSVIPLARKAAQEMELRVSLESEDPRFHEFIQLKNNSLNQGTILIKQDDTE
jgi:hypothetical protein